MEQNRKRFRKNENSNGRTESSETDPTNEDQGLVQTVPTLVSEIVLEELRDVKLLKTCRLVCKSWNIGASKSLRACLAVSLEENSQKLENFSVLLRKRERHSFQHFPSPFQNFHVKGTSFTDPTFINLVSANSNTCKSLTLVLPDEDGVDLDQSQLSLFLEKNEGSIAELTITANNNPGLQLNEALVKRAIRLTSVKIFTFIDYCDRCSHVQFLQNIMRMCRPTCLFLNIRDNESLPNLLLQNQVAHIKNLHLFCDTISRNVLTHLANTRLQLRKLSLIQNCFGLNVHLEYLEMYAFLKIVSPSLMEFGTNLKTGTKLRFPQLKEIYIRNYRNFLSAFTPNNFPSLTKIMLDVYIPIHPIQEKCVPHNGVQYCVINAPELINSFPQYNVGQLFLLLTSVSRQFPNVTSLEFLVPKFRNSTLSVCKAFPNLKTIKLDGECDFVSFAGFEIPSLNHGLPVEMIPNRGSILDFSELEVIKFGSEFCVSPDMIRHCLPRVRKLKQIELYWNSSLSAPLFRDFVGHLDKIVILGSDSFAAEMVQVQKLLPNSVQIL